MQYLQWDSSSYGGCLYMKKPEINDDTLFPETSQTAQQDSIGTELVKQNDYQGIKAETIMFRQQLFDVVVIDLTVHEVELFWEVKR